MASKSEKGHEKNVAAHKKITLIAGTLGTSYNPGDPRLKLPALNAQQATATASLIGAATAKGQFKAAANTRRADFKGMEKYITRINAAIRLMPNSKALLANAYTITRKIRGTRPPAVKDILAEPAPGAEAGTPAADPVSTSQQSYDQKLAYFAELKELLAAHPGYNPLEADLKIAGLNAAYNTYSNSNTNAMTKGIAFSNSRATRDTVLYKADTGVVDTGLAVKNYIISVWGRDSAQYKSVAKIEFRRIPK